MARKFFVGGTAGGTFSWPTGTGNNANWSLTSGVIAPTGLPTASDVVVFDNNSGTGAFTVNRTATAAIQGIEITRTNGVVTISGSTAWTLNGGSGAAISIPSGTTYDWTNTGALSITGTSTINAPTGILSPITINTSGITVTLAGNFLSGRTLTLTQGGINLATFTLTSQYFISAAGAGSRTLTFGSGSQLVLDNGVVSATSLDLSAAAVTISGTSSVKVRSYNQAQAVNSGTTRLNFTGISSGIVTLLNLSFTGQWDNIDVTGINRISIPTAASVFGTLTLTSVANFGGPGTLTFAGDSQTLTTGGLTIGASLAISGSGTFTFADNMTCSGALSHTGAVAVQQGPVTSVNITALSLSRTGTTGGWNTRGGTITLTGTNITVLTVQANAPFTPSNAAITFSGSPTSGTRGVVVPLPSAGTPTVNLTISGSDTVSFSTTSLASLTTTSFTGTFTGNLSLYANNPLTGITYPSLLLSVYLGAGTASLNLNAINTVTSGSGTLNLTNNSTITNLSSVGGTLNFTPSAGAYLATNVTCSNGGSVSILAGSGNTTLTTVTVSSGTISLNATGTLSVPTCNINGGTLELRKSLSGSNIINFNGGALTLAGGLTNVTTLTAIFSSGSYSNIIGNTVTASNLQISGGTYATTANFAVSSQISINSGTLSLAGQTATCNQLLQSGGTLDFGTSGALKARFALSVNSPAASAGSGGLFYIDGLYNGPLRSVNGDGYTVGVVVNDTAGTGTDVEIDATLVGLNTTSLTQPLINGGGGLILGNSTTPGTASFGNHDASTLVVTTSTAGGTLSTTTPAQGVASLTVPAGSSATLASAFKVIGDTSLSSSTLNLGGYTLETGTFSGSSSVLAFGTGGGSKLRLSGGVFSGTSGVTRTGTGTIELAGTVTNSFTIGGTSGSYSGVTLNFASALSTSSTVTTNGEVLGNITNSVDGMSVAFVGTGANATKVDAFNLQRVSVTSGVSGVPQTLEYTGAGVVSINECLVSNITATPSSTWTAYGSIDGGGNTDITFAGAIVPSPFTRAVRSFANPAAA